MSEQRRRVPVPVSLWPPGHPRALEYAEQEESEIVMRLGSAGDGGRRDGDGYSDSDAKSGVDSLFESEPEPVTLPESTHTLFFTQPVLSWPFFFAACIVVISIMCLILALTNGLDFGDIDWDDNPLNIPANVDVPVKIAQYLAVLIVLLMEEEIPTGLHQLRSIPAGAFKRAFPGQSYLKFFLATSLRLAMGYIFLVNVFIILAQATAVLDIFYDVLALQFIQQLDDIAFTVAKMDVLGDNLRRACTARLFQTEFDRTKARVNRRASLFLKSIYFVNLLAFLGGMSYVTIKQDKGDFQCKSIKVDFGDNVWEDAIVEGESEEDYQTRLLVFSTFNGEYVQEPSPEGRRPVYRETKKTRIPPEVDPTFDIEFDKWPGIQEGAVIKYDMDEEAWVFTHPKIRKTKTKASDGKVEWLLRSPQTDEFDLLKVGGDWSIWRGAIFTSTVTFTCNKCRSNTDCNLNGECIKDNDDNKVCRCTTPEESGGETFMGTQCEVTLKPACETIMDEDEKFQFFTWYTQSEDGSGEAGKDPLFQQYNRPVYVLPGATDAEINWLVYTGRRWIFIGLNLTAENMTFEELYAGTINFHAFWSEDFSFDSPSLLFMSDPTNGDTPVGVDWYSIGERGDKYGGQFGPIGALYPLQKNNQTGRGLFKCTGPRNAAMAAAIAASANMAAAIAVSANATTANSTSDEGA